MKSKSEELKRYWKENGLTEKDIREEIIHLKELYTLTHGEYESYKKRAEWLEKVLLERMRKNEAN